LEGLRKEREIGFFIERERDGWMSYGEREREWKDLMVSMSGPKIERFNGRAYFGPSWRENGLHAAHHYTRYGINYRLAIIKEEISVSNILRTPVGQHMI